MSTINGRNKKIISFLLSIGFILVLLFIITVILSYEASARIIFVDDDNKGPQWDGSWEYPYNKIQEGIDDAEDGDDVWVYDGIYKQDLSINKRINLTAKTMFGDVIIESNHWGDNTIIIWGETSWVNISGFIIREGYGSIHLEYSVTHCKIENCEIYNHDEGIYLDWYSSIKKGASYNTILNCKIHDIDHDGIKLCSYSYYNNIKGCEIYNNSFNGIYMYGGTLNTNISDCMIYNNLKYGFYTEYVEELSIMNCTISNNLEDGIFINKAYNYLKIVNNTIFNNSIFGIYIMNSATQNQISNNIIYNNSEMGIHLGEIDNCELFNNIIYNNSKTGMELWDFCNGLLYNNIIYNNSENGIYLGNCHENNIINCTILNNKLIGFEIRSSSTKNFVINSTFKGNGEAILIHKSSKYNQIYHNNFINTTKNNVYDDNINYWNNTSEGNYWSDYTGEDLDKNLIGDTPYNIEGGDNKDYHPLMKPIDWKNKLPIVQFQYFPENPTNLDEIQFIDNSSDLDEEIVTWFWEFGDGETSDEQNPKHKYTDNGTYKVNLTVTDEYSGINRTTKIIIVLNVIPNVNFTYYPKNPTTGDLIEFIDNSNDLDGTIISWFWDFGDDNISLDKNPTHQYSDNGTYFVNLTVTDNDNESNITTIEIVVTNIPPLVNFAFTPSDPTDLDEIEFTDKSYDSDGIIIFYHWDFGDGNTSNEKNPIHQYSIPDTYQIKLTVMDDDGAENFTLMEIIVIKDNDSPPVNPTFSPENGEKINTRKPKITITFSEEVTVIEIKLNGLNIYGDLKTNDKFTFIYTPIVDLPEGDNTISIKAKDMNGNEMTEPAICTFTIEIDETPPEISEIKSLDITHNSTTITWKTNEKCTSQIEYGTSDSYGKETTKYENVVTSHSITITDLEPSTTYHFRVKSIDEAGNENISKDYNFKTSEETDELNIDVKLEIDNTEPKEGETINITAKVTNNGKTSIEISVVFYDNEKKIAEKKITIESGKSGTSFYNWKAEGKGTHEIKVVIMYDGKEIKNVTDSKNVEVKEVKESDSGFNMIYLIPIIIVPIVVVFGLMMKKKATSKQQIQPQHQSYQETSQTMGKQSPAQSAFKICPFCNAQVPSEFKFCNMCGKQIEN